ncbi:MAG: alpha/beta hydrolase [Synechococcales bacterium]|nr:alpha/beta hydrolase [Synechococcales bacterium]
MPVAESKVIFITPTDLSPHRPDLPLFVFLPGMDGTGRLLTVQVEDLAVYFDLRCLVIPPTDLTDWDGLADQVAALIRAELKENPNRPVYLCGESFGGCLALKVVLRSPQIITRLILVNPASSFNRRPWIVWGSQMTRLLAEPVYQISCVGLLPFLANLERLEPSERRTLLQAMKSVSQKSSIWRLSLLAEFSVTPAELWSIRQPTLLVAGARDRLLPSLPEINRLARHIAHNRTYVLPNSGHACLLESDVSLWQILKRSQFFETSEGGLGLPQGSTERPLATSPRPARDV